MIIPVKTFRYSLSIMVSLCFFFCLCSCSGEAPAPPTQGKSSKEMKEESKAVGQESQTGEAPTAPPSGESGSSSESSGAPGTAAKAQGPVIEKVSFDPETPTTGDQVKAIATAKGSELTGVRFLYRWKVNGDTVQESMEDVLSHPIKDGDFIEVEVTPSDGLNEGKTVLHTALVANAPPKMTLTGQNLSGDGAYEAHVQASDADGDPVTFSLKSAPEGMTIDPTQGTIRWSVQSETKGNFGIEVSARDSKGAETLLSYQFQISWQQTPQPQEADNGTTAPSSSQ